MAPHKVLVVGTGKVGRLVIRNLADTGDYTLTALDRDPDQAETACRRPDGGALPGTTARTGDLKDTDALAGLMADHDYVVSCAPFHANVGIAELARAHGTHYLDPTEDVATTKAIKALAEGADQAFIPQCGLAPGFISIVAHDVASRFDSLDTVKMRVGALPVYPHNWLKYNLTWSTEGLVNEYCEPCEAVIDGELAEVPPLQNLEGLNIDGVEYEAFNTSGGLGTLAETLAGKVGNLNYKSMRYPGHRDQMALLLVNLKFREDRDTFCRVLERSLPHTYQDVVIIFVTVTGERHGRYSQQSYVKKIYGVEGEHESWGGIQITTAAGLCGVLDLHAQGQIPAKGFVRQEDVPFEAFIANRFGKAYA